MTTRDEITQLAALSRLRITDDEAAALQKEIESILSYVSAIQSVPLENGGESGGGLLVNVMREDGNPHEAGAYTKTLLRAAPHRKDDSLQVKQILSYEE